MNYIGRRNAGGVRPAPSRATSLFSPSVDSKMSSRYTGAVVPIWFGRKPIQSMEYGMGVEREAGLPVVNLTEYLDSLYSYGLALCRNGSNAEDLVQETCLRAIRAKNRLAPNSNVKSWMFTILRNTWLNQVRQSRRAPEITLDEDRVSDTSTDPHTSYVRNAERERVRAAIQHLPVDSREIIILRVYEEFSYREIAAILGCPVGTVMSRLSRARRRLRPLLLHADGGADRDLREPGPHGEIQKCLSNTECEC
jgi:RNA polymerase sigma-70 factor (ECF subfamily)